MWVGVFPDTDPRIPSWKKYMRAFNTFNIKSDRALYYLDFYSKSDQVFDKADELQLWLDEVTDRVGLIPISIYEEFNFDFLNIGDKHYKPNSPENVGAISKNLNWKLREVVDEIHKEYGIDLTSLSKEKSSDDSDFLQRPPIDSDLGKALARLKKSEKTDQIEYMIVWFHKYFEDPDNWTPRVKKDGELLISWRGGYDAGEQLHEMFDDFFERDVVDSAVNEIDKVGIVDWAPSVNHPDDNRRGEEWVGDQFDGFLGTLDHEVIRLVAGVQPLFGHATDLVFRERLLRRISVLQEELEKLTPQYGGMGHNNPPSDMELLKEKEEEIVEATETIRSELVKADPDALKVGKSAQMLGGVLKFFAEKGEMMLDEYLKELARFAAKATVVIPAIISIGLIALEIIKGAAGWLSAITLPF